MRKQVKNISLHQSSKVLALMQFILAAIVVLPIGSYVYWSTGETDTLTIFIIPFLYLIFGYLAGLLLFAVYNLVSRSFGGIEFELED